MYLYCFEIKNRFLLEVMNTNHCTSFWNMKKTLLLLILTGLIQFALSAQPQPDKDYILILHSSSFSEVSTHQTYEALQYTFSREGIPVKREELSIATVNDTTEAAVKLHQLAIKYPARPRLVVCIGDPAWIFIRSLFDTSWKEVPVLLCYSKDYVPQTLDILLSMNIDFRQEMVPTEDITKGYNLTRIKQPMYIDKTIATMKTLIPHLNQIAYICDNRYASVRTSQEIQDIIDTLYPDLELKILSTSQISTEKLLDTVSGLDSHTGLIYYSWFIPVQEGDNKYLVDNLTRLTGSFSSTPVFSVLDMNTRSGNFAGGHYIAIEDFSHTVVGTARKILEGTAPRNIPDQEGGSPNTYLNYEHLLRHDIPTRLYPDDAVYFEQPPSFMSKYKFHLIAVLAIYILVSIIAVQRFRHYLHRQKMKQRMYEASLLTEKLNQKYRLVLKSSEMTVWEWDLDKEEILCDRESLSDNETSFKKYTVDEKSFYANIHPNDEWKIRAVVKRLTEGSSKMLHEEVRVKLIRIPDVYNWIEFYAIVGERDENGTPRTLVGGFYITTERKLLEEELRKKEQEEKASQMKSAFLANISHEIRTPLNAIVGFSSLIAQGSCDADELAEYCKIIELNNSLLLKLIDDVLELSKIDSGEVKTEVTNINMSDLLVTLGERYNLQIHKGVSISYDLPEHPQVIYSDKEQISQALNNFISNACKFTSVGSIQIGYKQVEEGLHVYVSDTGKGISAENLPHVFDRFAKFDSFIQGTGLGLSVSQAIIKNLDGQIGVESELGKGSTFWFSIPCEVTVPV